MEIGQGEIVSIEDLIVNQIYDTGLTFGMEKPYLIFQDTDFGYLLKPIDEQQEMYEVWLKYSLRDEI